MAVAVRAGAQIQQGDLAIRLETVASGLASPVYATHAGDGSGRLFIVDQAGQIRIIEDGVLLPDPFLDLSSEIPELNPGFDERGVLGLAFHPDYAKNGRFFVRYSRPRTGDESEPCFPEGPEDRGCHEEVLAEFSVSLMDPNVADPTGTILFQVDEPQWNHNAGQVTFGPDGFLYFSLGDGGGANDSLDDPNLPHGPLGNGQEFNTYLGSLLRIDVDGVPPYEIPVDNPFVGGDGLDEIYAFGFRNPYRFSFDDGPGGSGELFLGDVGQNLFEEVDVVAMGGNYGWATREGFHCFDPFNPNTPPDICDDTGPNGEPLLDPIADYDHGDGIAVIGGSVYRGSRFPDFSGKYVFGDWIGGAGGRIFHLDADGTRSDILEFPIKNFDEPLDFVTGFGEDEDGELYVMTNDLFGPGGTAGQVFRIVPVLPEVHAVELVGMDFVPADLTVDLGDTVRWLWVSGFHNVESGVGGIHDGNFRSGDPINAPGTTFDVVFDQAFLDANPMPGNVYPYYCIVHVGVGMIGSITVRTCTSCSGDVDDDNRVDGNDIQAFVTCLLGGDAGASGCACADMDSSGTLDESDIALFADKLLTMSSPSCP